MTEPLRRTSILDVASMPDRLRVTLIDTSHRRRFPEQQPISVGTANVPFGQGWSSHAKPMPMPVKFSRDASGVVKLEGAARFDGSTVPAPAMFQLPIGYRPPFRETHLAMTETGDAPNPVLEIAPDGWVYALHMKANVGTVLYLSRHRFRAATGALVG